MSTIENNRLLGTVPYYTEYRDNDGAHQRQRTLPHACVIRFETLASVIREEVQLCTLMPPKAPFGSARFAAVAWDDVLARWEVLQQITTAPTMLALFVHHQWTMRWLCVNNTLGAVVTPIWHLASGGRISEWRLRVSLSEAAQNYPAADAVFATLQRTGSVICEE